MKRPILLVLGTMLALGAGAWADTAKETAAKVAGLYRQGLQALNEGDAARAKQYFTAVLQIQPGHGNARFQLLNLKNRQPQMVAAVRKRKLSQVRVPKVDFDEVTVPDAIEALRILIEKETKGECNPNFIVQDAKGLFDNRPITMKLGSVPANVVLEYILRMGDGTARYDEYAIVIRPLGGSSKPNSENPGKKTGGESRDPFAP